MSTQARQRHRRAYWKPLFAVSAVSLAVLAGCGQTATPTATPTPGSSTVSPSPSASASDAGQVDLTIVADVGSGKQTWKVSCAPPGGSHPDPETACRVLAEAGKQALPAVPKDRVCTQIYGGPEKATVTGTWNGETILSTFARNNGCEIGRWKMLEGFLPRPAQ